MSSAASARTLADDTTTPSEWRSATSTQQPPITERYGRCRLVSITVAAAAFAFLSLSSVAGASSRFARSTGASVPLRTSTGAVMFTDATGDSGAAPDVTEVSVSNDDLGLITVRISVPNRLSLGPDDVLLMPIATDDPDIVFGPRPSDGASFVIVWDGRGVFLARWNGEEMPIVSAVTGDFSGGVATASIKREDLAPGFPDMSVPVELDFYVLGLAFSGNDVLARDDAPEGDDWWHYGIAAAPRLIVTYFDAASTVKAGKTLAVYLGAAHADTGAMVTSGTITCTARVGKTTLRGQGAFSSIPVTNVGPRGRSITSTWMTCKWKIPKSASRKTLKGSIAVTDGGLTVAKSFGTAIR
jgi:hypothetical protein